MGGALVGARSQIRHHIVRIGSARIELVESIKDYVQGVGIVGANVYSYVPDRIFGGIPEGFHFAAGQRIFP